MQHNNISAAIIRAPNTEPTTIPASCPPDKPLSADGVFAATTDDPVGDGVPLVADGKRGGMEAMGGRVTPTQRFVTSEPTQQESVAFGELAAQ